MAIKSQHAKTEEITDIILKAAEVARAETGDEPEPEMTTSVEWPVQSTVGPGLEGAIACESKIGYVNGTKGWLVYRGYDIFDLCAYSTFEEVSYLLLHGNLPTSRQLSGFKRRLAAYRHIPNTMRQILGFPVEQYNPMAALRMGTLFLRRQTTDLDMENSRPDTRDAIGSDEDSIPMETPPVGETQAIYQFAQKLGMRPKKVDGYVSAGADYESSYRLIAAMGTLTSGITRIRAGELPLNPRDDLSHAANLLYLMTGRVPTPLEERVMDVSLILHADHGMNASTFAAMVVASTLSDVYFSVGAGIGALNGPLHGGANEQVLHLLEKIGGPRKVKRWYSRARARKQKVMGFGHRVYKAYDPRARILGPLAEFLVARDNDPKVRELMETAQALEQEVVSTLGKQKGIFPNVDFYSGLVYASLNVPPEMFTPLFAVSRVSGWTARVMEYLQNNRIFRPRAVYTGEFDKKYVPLSQRK